jgi:hypothetical protein
MSLLTDLFVADSEEIQLLDSDLSLNKFDVFQSSRVDPIKISTLDEILTGQTLDIAEPVAATGGFERFIFSIRPELRAALAESSAVQLKNVADSWAQTEEWILDGGTAEDLTQWLENASRLANEAQVQGKELYVCISL